MPATGTFPTLPSTSWPAWPIAVDLGKCGIFVYGIFVAAVNSSAKAPRPEPRTKARRGRGLVLARMNFAARSARENSEFAAGVDFGIMLSINLAQRAGHTCDVSA